MKTLFSHPTGNANVRAALKGLSDAKILSDFYTSIATFPGSRLDKLSNIKSLGELKRRGFDSEIEAVTQMFPWYETGRILSNRLGLANLTKHERGVFCIDNVYQTLDKKVASVLKNKAKAGIEVVYAYEDGASESFKEAKKHDLKCYYDLPIGYWRAARKLLENEYNRWPDWVPTLTGFQDSDEKLERKDEELRLADYIFVASQFTADTLKYFPGKLSPIEVIPYGFPKASEERVYQKADGNRPIKLLFVGGLSQRKGIADLFAAVEEFGSHVELTVVGKKASENCPALDAALQKHKWIPSLPHQEILKLMQTQDVFLFPSLFEGFGLVITEAMSQGTPVITTDRTAGPNLIKDGESGWLVQAGFTDALKSKISEILDRPQLLEEVGRQALKKAISRPWEVYGKELAKSILNNNRK